MNSHRPTGGKTRNRASWIFAAASIAAGLLLAGCTPDAEHRDIPVPAVKPVTAYGLTLDENATPQQVTFVVLRSIADDVHDARSHDRAKQQEAMRLTHSLLAYSVIEQQLIKTEKLARPNVDSLGPDRNEKLWDFSRQLAPIVGYYVNSFDTTFDAAAARMRLIGTLDRGLIHVQYDAAHDRTATDPKERDPVIIDVEMSKERGEDAKQYWRVVKIGFFGRPVPRPAAIRPALVPGGAQLAVPHDSMNTLTTMPATTSPGR